MADDHQVSQPPLSPEPVSEPTTETLDLSTDLATPTVDELEDRLADLQGAMDKLQSGDFDGAEASIAALEEQLATTRGSAS